MSGYEEEITRLAFAYFENRNRKKGSLAGLTEYLRRNAAELINADFEAGAVDALMVLSSMGRLERVDLGVYSLRGDPEAFSISKRICSNYFCNEPARLNCEDCPSKLRFCTNTKCSKYHKHERK